MHDADDPFWPIKLDRENRYVQGPTVGKADWLLGLGARQRRMPRKFPLPENQLVAVIKRSHFDAALWVQDEIDFERCRQAHEADIVVWLEIPSDWLFPADPAVRKPTRRSCEGCRWWSDRIAGSDQGGPLLALCLNEAGPFHGTMRHEGCSTHQSGDPIDRRRRSR